MSLLVPEIVEAILTGRQPNEKAYLFGAICPARGAGPAVAVSYAATDAMQLHLNENSRHLAKAAHAVLLLDRTGWHTTTRGNRLVRATFGRQGRA